MSHVTEVAVEITDLGCLERAAKRLGLELRYGQETYRWFGRHMGDYAIPAGFTQADLGKCQHAISMPNNSAAYEVGVVKRRDGKPGYTLHFDFWSGGYGIEAVVGVNCNKLVNLYSAEVATQEAMMLGYSVMGEKINEDGSIELLIQA
jgi:hypothetical protein